ncbi:MAG: T9SS type A sorting domain-containing protein [Crocinitomicaceae bacterium]|nr:T9SS type A sorting domain-containing protein [Crocinitomicaceae bacterium]
MKTLLSALSFCLLSTLTFSQVSFSVTAPASIAGGYNFTSNGDGTDWGLANLFDPNNAVLDTLKLVEDGTPGFNAQGIPFSNEGCGTLNNDLTGKIAVVYRYDGISSNVCWYGTKVLMAAQAGAIGVVMINREDALIAVPGTTDGPNTSIPFAFISRSDGAILRARMDAGEDVVAFIGNKLGLYSNDGGINKITTISPSISSTASQTSVDNTEFGFDVGAQIYNYGNVDQNNVSITATVTGPAGTWTETSGPYSIAVGDSIEVYTGGTNDIPAFSFPAYPDGRYTLTYDVDLGVLDSFAFDNTLSYDFVISDSLIGYSRTDVLTNLPVSNANYRPGGGGNLFEMCMVYNNPNGSKLAAEGIYFSAVTGYNSGVSLDGEEISISLYSWDNVFIDINDVNLAFDNLNLVSYGYFYYPGDLQDEVVLGTFDTQIQLSDNQRYLACVQPSNVEIYLGHDTGIDYNWSINTTLEPITPINSDNGYFALGFGTDIVPSMALRVFDADELGVPEYASNAGSIFPNPAKDILNIALRSSNTQGGTITVLDMTGRILSMEEFSYAHMNKMDVNGLTSGQYLLTVDYNDGIAEQFKFVKN